MEVIGIILVAAVIVGTIYLAWKNRNPPTGGSGRGSSSNTPNRY